MKMDDKIQLSGTVRSTLSFHRNAYTGNCRPYRPVFAAERIAFSAKENPSADPVDSEKYYRMLPSIYIGGYTSFHGA